MCLDNNVLYGQHEGNHPRGILDKSFHEMDWFCGAWKHHNALVGNIGHLDNASQMDELEGFPGIKVENIKPMD